MKSNNKELFDSINKFLKEQKELSDEIAKLERERNHLGEKITQRLQTQQTLGCNFVRDTGLTMSDLTNKCNQQIYRDENDNFYRIEIKCYPHNLYDCSLSFKPVNFFWAQTELDGDPEWEINNKTKWRINND